MSGSGFTNDVVHAENVDFSGGFPVSGQITTSGQLLIGNSSAPHIRPGRIVSSGGTITVSYNAPDINLEASGGSVTITGDSGTPISGSSLTIYANRAGNVSGATVFFENDGTNTSTLRLSNITGLTFNTLLGSFCGNEALVDQGGNNLTGLGYGALSATTNSANSTGIGSQAMTLAQTCSSCVAVGANTLNNLVSGNDVTAVGAGALSGYLGSQATAVGSNALTFNTSGVNSALGYLAGRSITTGSGNTTMGWISMVNGGTSSNNCAYGHQSLTNITGGNSNSAFGYASGSAYTSTESGNITIDNQGVVGESNVIRIGTNQTTCYVKGISGVTTGGAGTAVLVDTNGQLGTISSSAAVKENIEDIEEESEKIYRLRPVSFDYIGHKHDQVHYGLIAEQVEEEFPELNVYDNEGNPATVKYHELPVLMLKELQKMNKRLTTLENRYGG